MREMTPPADGPVQFLRPRLFAGRVRMVGETLGGAELERWAVVTRLPVQALEMLERAAVVKVASWEGVLAVVERTRAANVEHFRRLEEDADLRAHAQVNVEWQEAAPQRKEREEQAAQRGAVVQAIRKAAAEREAATRAGEEQQREMARLRGVQRDAAITTEMERLRSERVTDRRRA